MLASLVWFALAGAATPTPPTPGTASYVVKAGDTLWSLARARGCRISDLVAANPSQAETLRPGNVLVLPRCSQRAAAYTVRAGDTLSALAVRFACDVQTLRDLNGIRGSHLRVGQVLRIPHGGAALTPRPRWVVGQSVGRPQRGRLHGGLQLPHDPAYYRRRPHQAWAAQHVVDQVRAAIARVRVEHPHVHRLAIGDLSAVRGGPIREHSSHQSGRDVDLGLYYTKPPANYPREFVSMAAAELDVGALWSLVSAFYEQSKLPGGPEKIFLDYQIQKKLHQYARKQGASAEMLRALFQYPDGPWARDRLVQHVRKHDDHLHVRFACPPEDVRCQ